MKNKLITLLNDKVKDFGLSAKAIEGLIATIEGKISEETTEEELGNIVESLAGYAKLMQAEVTRKSQKQVTPKVEDLKKDDDVMPEWFKTYKAGVDAELTALKEKNQQLEQERTQAERTALISSKAKALGIPESLMKRISLAEDADIEKELSEIKQELINTSLPAKEESSFLSSSDKEIQEDAENWIKSFTN